MQCSVVDCSVLDLTQKSSCLHDIVRPGMDFV